MSYCGVDDGENQVWWEDQSDLLRGSCDEGGGGKTKSDFVVRTVTVVGRPKGRLTKIAVYTLNVQDEKSLFNAQQTEACRQPKYGCVEDLQL